MDHQKIHRNQLEGVEITRHQYQQWYCIFNKPKISIVIVIFIIFYLDAKVAAEVVDEPLPEGIPGNLKDPEAGNDM